MSYSVISQLFQEELYKYESPVIVVLARDWADYTSEQQTLLQKILTSVKINISSVQMICLPFISVNSLALFSPARVLIFGAKTNEEIGLYQQTPAQGFIVVRADDLDHLDENRKKELWTVLRQMFNV